MKLIDIVAGARPNFMKVAPILEALETMSEADGLAYRLIHTGQHYDKAMSGSYFEQLRIPEPAVNFGVGGGTEAEQTGGIMIAYETLLTDRLSDLCLVVGDVTSTMACAITAKKMGVRVAHVEAGIRSGDLSMPEEINRMATDALTDLFFTTSETASAELCRCGVAQQKVFLVGNTMIDTLFKQRPHFKPPSCWIELGLENGQFFVLTLHRPTNVDEKAQLNAMLDAIVAGANGVPIVFPIHPRTRKTLKNGSVDASNLHLVPPLPYLEFNYLVSNALGVITDSGGITEETTVMGIPCMTLRDSTERPETITIGTNELVGTNPSKLSPYLERLGAGKWKTGGIPKMWDGKAGQRIVEVLARELG